MINHNFKKGQDREEKIDIFLDTLAWFHSQKNMPTGLFATVGKIERHLGALNTNLTEANKSSEALTKALNRITLAGVLVAAASLLVSIILAVLK